MIKKSVFMSIVSAGLLTTGVALAGPFGGVHETSSGMNLSATGTVFNQNLYAGYRDLSKELNNHVGTLGGNIKDVELFNHKAVLAGHESPVDPDAVMDRKLSHDQATTFSNALHRLRVAFNRGAREFAPVQIARAQVSYDCWIEAVEDNSSNRASECKQKFEESLAAAEQVSTKDLVSITISPPLAPLVDAPAQRAVEVEDIPQAVLDQYFIVPFEFDSTEWTAAGRSNLQGALDALKRYNTLRVNLTAHADRAGPDNYNQKLSQRRADAVLTHLVQAGITADRIDVVEAVGESRPLVPTADGVKNPENRVVELDLKR